MAEVLLAKSGAPGGQPVTIGRHTNDVVHAAGALFGMPGQATGFTPVWCGFFGIHDVAKQAEFLLNLLAAVFCHDWGKGNDGFQGMLAQSGRQLLRHEKVSAMLMCWPSVWAWLEKGKCDLPLVLSAVVGHHLQASVHTMATPEAEVDQGLRLHWGNHDFQAWLAQTAPMLGLSTDVPKDVPRSCEFNPNGPAHDLDELLNAAIDQLEGLDAMLQHESASDRRRMLWAVRAALIVSDAAGSGLTRENKPITDWIAQCMRFEGTGSSPDGRMTGQTIRHHVIEPRIQTIRQHGKWHGFNPFQAACGEARKVPARALLLAPCGSGKTLAAWNWIATRLDERPRSRAIFLYPTRGTATEGYRDYAGLAGEDLASLVHGSADLDLDALASDQSVSQRILDARLFALRQWNKRVFSATVDQFLGFMQHGYAATCQLPLLADSVLVLDEVHSYDRGMWSALIEFLCTFPDIPALCMTATLLTSRMESLRESGVHVIDGLDLDGSGHSALRLAASHGRYCVQAVTDESAASAIAAEALAKGRRVLWVVNTVNRCQGIVRQFAGDLSSSPLHTPEGWPVFCYHSRYRLGDRKQWHQAVVEAFKPSASQGGVLAVATQVCEMSLDLDADLLITETCPATAMVQRLGRCCRDPQAHVKQRVGQVVIYPPVSMQPYSKDDMQGVDGLVDAMTRQGVVSQQQLAQWLEQMAPPVELPKACRFTQSGVWAHSGEEQFRDGDDLSRPALLPSDLKEYARLRDPRRRGSQPTWQAEALVIPIPKNFTEAHGEHGVPPWLHQAINGTYRPALGYCCGDIPRKLIV